MDRRRRSRRELRKASDHLHYEIWMLGGLARELASGVHGPGVIRNALLESFTIHARALLDFLYARDKPRPDDVIAEDFFADPEEWHRARPPKSQEMRKVHRRVAKEIAHLTYARQQVTPETKGWRFLGIADEVSAIVGEFLAVVPERSLGSRWQACEREADNNHAG